VRRLSVALLLFSLCAVGTAEAGMKLIHRQAIFRTQTTVGGAQGYVDSSTASINGALQTVDTAYVDLSDILWENFSVGAGQFGAARIWFTSTANTSVDTLFFALEPLAPDGQPVPSTTFNNAIATTAGDEGISALITSDSDYISPNIAFCKAVRIRVRADGNTGALFPNARIWLTFYADSP